VSFVKRSSKAKGKQPTLFVGKLGYAGKSTFQIGQVLGKGSFGTVRIARSRKTGFLYAVKILKKVEILNARQAEHVFDEKRIMEITNGHPSIITMFGTFQDERNLYMVLELAQGGEMFKLLRRLERFETETAKFYCAQVILGLHHLHMMNIVYRDLKPENLMLDSRGNVKIVDFGFAKIVEDRTWTLCGTPEYVAPEIIRCEGYGAAVDWWSMGVLLYEFLVGWPPFLDENPMKLYEKILKARLGFPSNMDPNARLCIREFLQTDRSKRLGNLIGGVERVVHCFLLLFASFSVCCFFPSLHLSSHLHSATSFSLLACPPCHRHRLVLSHVTLSKNTQIKEHPFFATLDWVKLKQQQLQPPIIPTTKGYETIETEHVEQDPLGLESKRRLSTADESGFAEF